MVGHRTGGGVQELELRVPDDPLLPRLHRRECDLRALAEAVDALDGTVVFGLRPGAALPLSVTVRPDADGVALLERLLADVCAPR